MIGALIGVARGIAVGAAGFDALPRVNSPASPAGVSREVAIVASVVLFGTVGAFVGGAIGHSIPVEGQAQLDDLVWVPVPGAREQLLAAAGARPRAPDGTVHSSGVAPPLRGLAPPP